MLRLLPARRLAAALLLLAALLAGWPCLDGGTAAAADYFGRPDGPPPASVSPPAAPPALEALPLPGFLRDGLAASLALQSQWNARLRGQLQQARDGASWMPAFAIIGLSFLYGVFHAVGPGHGKVVVGSYFLTRRARLAHGLGMSLAAALSQALSAILLVGGLAALFDVSGRHILDHAATLEMVSSAALVVLGGWMAWGALSGRRCSHDHGGHDHAGHDHAGESCGCAHHHGHHAHDHHPHAPPEAAPPPAGGTLRHALALGSVVGLRPCSGAILVLMFTLANGIFLVGVLSTLAMAMGVAITVALVSLATLGLHRSLGALGQRFRPAAQWVYRAVAAVGALMIALFGALQLIGAWTGLLTPLAG